MRAAAWEGADWDAVVVGGGPAGAMAALGAAQGGARTLLLERRHRALPVRCGELMRADILAQLGLGDLECTDDRTDTLTISTQDCQIDIRGREWALVNREAMEERLLDRAAAAGAEVARGARLASLARQPGGGFGVTVATEGQRLAMRARTVVAADGVGSRTALLAGLQTESDRRDIALTAHAIVSLPASGIPSCGIHLDEELTPGGYAWLFRRSNGRANVGVGIRRSLAGRRRPRDVLDAWFDRCLGRPCLSATIGGSIPACGQVRLGAPGLLLAGDAARLADPLTGAGLGAALLSGHLAGQALAAGPESAQARYAEWWRDQAGESHARGWHARTALDGAPGWALAQAMRDLKDVGGLTSVHDAMCRLSCLAGELSGTAAGSALVRA